MEPGTTFIFTVEYEPVIQCSSNPTVTQIIKVVAIMLWPQNPTIMLYDLWYDGKKKTRGNKYKPIPANREPEIQDLLNMDYVVAIKNITKEVKAA